MATKTPKQPRGLAHPARRREVQLKSQVMNDQVKIAEARERIVNAKSELDIIKQQKGGS